MDNCKPCGGAIPLCMIDEFDLPKDIVDRQVRKMTMISPTNKEAHGILRASTVFKEGKMTLRIEIEMISRFKTVFGWSAGSDGIIQNRMC